LLGCVKRVEFKNSIFEGLRYIAKDFTFCGGVAL
jgi:hypothetical protein